MLFNTAGFPIIFEPQYLRVKTSLPLNANIYGLGEHTESLRLPTQNTTRTLWSRDSYGVPPGTNLYGVHPIYLEHRTTGTHGVFFLNSNGMDIKLRNEGDRTTLEYNVIGGILDFYFLAGPSPIEVAQQYAALAGLPAEVPYWSLGFHQCRYGYQNYVEVSQVISNYSIAGIPLETMWTDSMCALLMNRSASDPSQSIICSSVWYLLSILITSLKRRCVRSSPAYTRRISITVGSSPIDRSMLTFHFQF